MDYLNMNGYNDRIETVMEHIEDAGRAEQARQPANKKGQSRLAVPYPYTYKSDGIRFQRSAYMLKNRFARDIKYMSLLTVLRHIHNPA